MAEQAETRSPHSLKEYLKGSKTNGGRPERCFEKKKEGRRARATWGALFFFCFQKKKKTIFFSKKITAIFEENAFFSPNQKTARSKVHNFLLFLSPIFSSFLYIRYDIPNFWNSIYSLRVRWRWNFFVCGQFSVWPAIGVASRQAGGRPDQEKGKERGQRPMTNTPTHFGELFKCRALSPMRGNLKIKHFPVRIGSYEVMK